MKVLFISPSLKNGGAEKMISYVSSVCNSDGIVAMVYALGFGINEVNYDSSIPVINCKKTATGKLSLLQQIYDLRVHIKKQQPDFLCSFTPYATKIAYMANLGIGTPIIASERDNPYHSRSISINNWFYNRCKRVVFQTEGARNAFKGKTHKNGIIIPNPNTSEIMEPVLDRRKVFISAGRMTTVKRFDNLILAFEKFRKKNPDYKLHIYGDGPEKEKLQNLIKEHGLEDSVFLMGWKDDPFSNEIGAACFVLASITEGMPNVLIEAMARGIPCISTDSLPGGPRELLDDGNNGILVPIDNIDALASAMENCINDIEETNRKCMNARDKLKELSPQVINKKWIELFQNEERIKK